MIIDFMVRKEKNFAMKDHRLFPESKTRLQGKANVRLHPQNTNNNIQLVYKQLPLQTALPGFVKGNLLIALLSAIKKATVHNDLM